jgi:hypothetical protein
MFNSKNSKSSNSKRSIGKSNNSKRRINEVKGIYKNGNTFTITAYNSKNCYKGEVYKNGSITKQFKNFCKRNKLVMEEVLVNVNYLSYYENCNYINLLLEA